MKFEFATSDQIIFGEGSLESVGEFALKCGTKALVIVGSGSVPNERLLQILKAVSIESAVYRVDSEPDIQKINQGLDLSKIKKCDFVIGFGGGSVLDSAKAIAALMNNPGDVMDYLEVIGSGKQIKNHPAPMIALPTTAGTGTEVTRNAVISSSEFRVKVSMRSPLMIPTVAIVDPELTYNMPPSVTASTGMDALTQVIEAFVSSRANPMTDAIAREGIKRAGRSLLIAYRNGRDKAARQDMALTSLFGGLALANCGLGAVHGFAGPIGGMFNAPHGEICASLLPYVMKFNVMEICKMDGMQETRSRFRDVAGWLTGDSEASIEDGVGWLVQLASDLKIPGLRDIGIRKEDFDQIIEKSKVSSSMKKNPVQLDDKMLKAILMEAY